MVEIIMMTKELSYVNPEGHTVFTSQFLKNRKTCCKTGCLHCPYGYSIKKWGLQFQDLKEDEKVEVENILEETETHFDFSPYWPDNTKLVTLKGQVCGVMFKNHIVIKKLILKPYFQDQGISKELVESYFFC